MDKLRVAFTGPSGSGKTTLVRFISEKYSIPWLNGSNGSMKNPKQVAEIERFGVKQGKGHVQVIQSGHANPTGAFLNQQVVLENRIKVMVDIPPEGSFVTDRSTIDNMVYCTIQCGPYLKDFENHRFLTECTRGLQELTHLIYVPPMLNPVEDNGSRIANYYYQRAMGAVFEEFLGMYRGFVKNTLYITELDLDKRKQSIVDFLGTN